MLSNPVFIIGTERSGSNLLRLMLNSHSRIAIPHPPHLLRDLEPLKGSYGDLSSDKEFLRLCRDVARIVGLHFSPWPIAIRGRDLFDRAESRSFYGVYAALYDLYLEYTGKARWGCKSTFMYREIGEVVRHHREPRFLHLVRDPRDVAASAGESIFSRYHPYKQGELWAAQQREIEKWVPELGPRMISRIRYEDLTENPSGQLQRIMDFLDEKFEPAQLEFFRTRAAGDLSRLSESWKNCAVPVSRGSVGRYKKELSARDIAWVEFHARDLMDRYGYPAEGPERVRAPSLPELLKIEGEERWRMLETEGRSLLKDKNFSLRWKKWMYLQALRGARRIAHG